MRMGHSSRANGAVFPHRTASTLAAARAAVTGLIHSDDRLARMSSSWVKDARWRPQGLLYSGRLQRGARPSPAWLQHAVLRERRDQGAVLGVGRTAPVDPALAGECRLMRDENPRPGIELAMEVQRVADDAGGQRAVGVLDPHGVAMRSHAQLDEPPVRGPREDGLAGR